MDLIKVCSNGGEPCRSIHKELEGSCTPAKLYQTWTLYVYIGKWQGYHVAISSLASPRYKEDFDHNLEMLQKLSPSPYVVQLVGFCGDILVTEFHPWGSARDVHRHQPTLPMKLQLCLSYIQVLAFLHNSPVGTRVMCDSNTLEKTLTQFLLTEDFHLVANDLDALPEVKPGQGVKCGHEQLHGTFVAPEQLWPYGELSFEDDQMPPYDEKTDIWKIPDVCHWFLQDETSVRVKQKLRGIHHLCKNENPTLRPSAKELVDLYQIL
ncbi:POMK [Cordylochernes scorpioides]|uniref:POMK n=1 Tax=Cordylochernes scorpioides TaxID=51811 RepID=A0ABY6LBP5_9ARAC|nr:POMK [Cordylochernes scorpioides]